MAEHHRATQVSGRGVDGRPAKLESEADDKVTDPGDDEGGEVEHHHVTGVLCAGQPCGEECEPRLHEEYEGARYQQPGKVDSDLFVAHEGRQPAGLVLGAFGRVLFGGWSLTSVREGAPPVPGVSADVHSRACSGTVGVPRGESVDLRDGDQRD